MDELAEDPHALACGLVAEVDGVPMGPLARLSATPGRLRWGWARLGADTDAVLAELDEP